MSAQKSWKLFRPEGFGPNNVHLDWLEGYTPHAMAEAFKISADRVIDSMEDEIGHPDKYFYPAAYLYRHSFELILKHIIDLGREALPQSNTRLTPWGHDLNLLWTQAKDVILFVFAKDDPLELIPIGEAICEFAKIDPDGQNLRYYRDRKGKKNLSAAPRVISLQVLKRGCEQVFRFLDGCSMGISNFVDAKYEYENQCAADGYM